MADKPHSELLRRSFSEDIEENMDVLRKIFNVPENEDPIFREYRSGAYHICVAYLEGMADDDRIGEFVLHAIKHAEGPRGADPAQILNDALIEIAQTSFVTEFEEAVRRILAGMTCLMVDGSAQALILETRNYPHRSVEQPTNESVVDGPHEAFNEHLRTNITLVHRYVQSTELIVEKLNVGTAIPTQVAILHLKGVANDSCVQEVRRRLKSIRSTCVMGSGAVQQLIEDRPFALLPQMMQTERPDRAASCLEDGQVAILVENSPYALIAPVTFFHLVHAPDDSFLRWQYGTALRIIRTLGLLISLTLPALYIAMTMYHTHLIPMELLTSIAEARANVPFPVLVEVLFMEFSFYLLNEAGLRTPSQIGSAFGIVGALILGQAAVSASIVSPILIIIIALTGLGNYVVPNYGLGIGLILYRLGLIALSALLGVYGLMIGLFLIVTHLCSIKSFGVDYLAPVSPWRRHNPDILLRLPLWMQKRVMFFARKNSWLRQDGGAE